MGILMGGFALDSTWSQVPFWFYSGAVFWTIGYDTIYAFQDREDDLLAGVKSSALVVSSIPKLFLGVMYGTALLVWTRGGIVAHFGASYWVFLSLIGIHFTWQVLTLKEKDPLNCLKRFTSNINIGLLLFLAIVFSRLID
jgi:4-hydroxybenzoate polyprenyltransferase